MSDFVRRVPAGAASPLAARLPVLDIELTERCDNECVHCCINLPSSDRAAQSRELTTGQWMAVLDQAAELGCLQVRFTGGEPLLRPDFEELYLHARRLGMKVLLFTNARQLGSGRTGGRGDRLGKLLADVPPLVPVEVSVYGICAASYEAVTRSAGSFAQFMRGIDRLMTRGIPFLLKGAILPPNEDEIDEFEAWCSALSASDVPRYVLQLDLRDRRDDAEKNARIRRLRLSPQKVLAVLTRREPAYRREKAEFAMRFMGTPGARLFHCGAGRAVSIDAYGRAQPCLGLRAPDLTIDVASRPNGPTPDKFSLETALDAFASLDGLRATDPDYLRRCARCFLFGFCEQCPAKSWKEHGVLDRPVDYHCEVAHVQARYLGWLAEEEQAWDVADWFSRTRQLSRL